MSQTTTNKMDVFNKGAILSIIIKSWTGSAKAGDEVLSNDLPKELLRASQDLLDDKSTLEALRKIRNEVKNHVYANSVSTDVDNLSVIPKARIPYFNDYLKEKSAEYMGLAETFINDQYELLRNTFATKYPELYREDRYPSKAVLTGKFQFSWKFRTLGVDPTLQDIDPDIYKEEMSKFKTEMAEFKDKIMVQVGTELMSRLKTLQGQAEGKAMNGKTIKSVNDFLDKFENVFSDFSGGRMRNLVKQAREMMDGVENLADVKGNDELIDQINETSSKLIQGIKNIPNKKLKRALDI